MRWLVLLLLLSACVPHVPLEGAPCPCGDGATCCTILGVCLPEGAACPSTVPSSSDPCTTNADCGANEACAAWRLDDGQLSGPRVCRRACSDHPCDGEERCLFTLADGRPSSELSIAKLCLDVAPSCEAWTCDGCGDLELGEVTPCVPEQEIFGCLFSLHPTCGLKCERRQLGACDNLVAPCTSYDCNNCPNQSVGAAICDMGTERSCLVSAAPVGMGCEQLCVEVETGSCEP